jgi:hypothetical protein
VLCCASLWVCEMLCSSIKCADAILLTCVVAEACSAFDTTVLAIDREPAVLQRCAQVVRFDLDMLNLWPTAEESDAGYLYCLCQLRKSHDFEVLHIANVQHTRLTCQSPAPTCAIMSLRAAARGFTVHIQLLWRLVSSHHTLNMATRSLAKIINV